MNFIISKEDRYDYLFNKNFNLCKNYYIRSLLKSFPVLDNKCKDMYFNKSSCRNLVLLTQKFIYLSKYNRIIIDDLIDIKNEISLILEDDQGIADSYISRLLNDIHK